MLLKIFVPEGVTTFFHLSQDIRKVSQLRGMQMVQVSGQNTGRMTIRLQGPSTKKATAQQWLNSQGVTLLPTSSSTEPEHVPDASHVASSPKAQTVVQRHPPHVHMDPVTDNDTVSERRIIVIAPRTYDLNSAFKALNAMHLTVRRIHNRGQGGYLYQRRWRLIGDPKDIDDAIAWLRSEGLEVNEMSV